ncbi:MAG: PEP-CTERM sorting domain-containing protein, partial [Akkermansiaceae bacterium]
DLTGGYVNRDIAGKLYTGFFSLDGVNVDPDGTGFVGSGTGGALASEADVVALNAFIKANYTIGGRYLELSDNTGGERTLSVIAVPEPSSTALLGLGGLALILRRRK